MKDDEQSAVEPSPNETSEAARPREVPRDGRPSRPPEPARRDPRRSSAGEPRRVEIVLRVETAPPERGESPVVKQRVQPAPVPGGPPVSINPAPLAELPSREEPERPQIPARMLNEFVYCPRLFYYEFVEGVFVESSDTLRGAAIYQRVDSGSGALPKAKRKIAADRPGSETPPVESGPETPEPAEPETIHSRSVQMGSERLGVTAKMDLVEARAAAEDLLSVLEVCPVDYKAGAPREGEERNELWDTDKMQLGLQALILRDNGYTCPGGVIYYRATKQRVRLPITPALESWILQQLVEARAVMTGPMPAPLVHSPKCVRCSLAPVCLPDETRMLAPPPADGQAGAEVGPASGRNLEPPGPEVPRRLIAARDDSRPLYLNTQGYRVGCKDEVLQVKEKDRIVEEIRLRDVSHVALFGNIQISTQAIQVLCENEVPVTYFSMGGWFYGITRGHGLKNVCLRMEQFRLAGEEGTCLALARQFVHGKIRNHRTMLMRNHLEPPEPVLLKLKRASEDVLAAASLEELLGMEGAAASQYFQEFKVSYRRALELQARLLAKALTGEIAQYVPLLTR